MHSVCLCQATCVLTPSARHNIPSWIPPPKWGRSRYACPLPSSASAFAYPAATRALSPAGRAEGDRLERLVALLPDRRPPAVRLELVFQDRAAHRSFNRCGSEHSDGRVRGGHLWASVVCIGLGVSCGDVVVLFNGREPSSNSEPRGPVSKPCCPHPRANTSRGECTPPFRNESAP